MSRTRTIVNDSDIVTRSDGTKKWRRDARLYREDGPAVELPMGIRSGAFAASRIAKTVRP
ncbi:hypothetical protein [Allomesorhizobium camelthorni]|uniref:Uncharacterized protein n=1 Tax=Allomesorhizobium camelthorni TaxID=475069 RepID=A0A6G4WA52_9HYPH|nr:hypothetical protein [Mesorhizobium camelthorni]NGO51093.1 hypothetical protein [Mesorhizobium camelthorni]